jgi:hypothetical protein
VIDFALLLDKNFKQESQLRTYLLAVVSHVVWDAMEVIPLVLGVSLREVVLLQVDCTEINNGANLTFSHLAITTQLVNMDLVERVNPLPNAKSHVSMEKIILEIRSMPLKFTQFLVNKKS